MVSNQLVTYLNEQRIKNGFLSIEQVVELAETNTIFDPFSVLIGSGVKIGKGNTLYPNVTIELTGGAIVIGDNNTFSSGLRIVSKSGEILIGNYNQIGENQTLIQSTGSQIHINNYCRIMNGAIVLDGCYLGQGSQVLGTVKLTKCHLGDGESYVEKNPNLRGGVIKGFGTAIDLRVDAGFVINGQGPMNQTMVEKQETYHPNWRIEG